MTRTRMLVAASLFFLVASPVAVPAQSGMLKPGDPFPEWRLADHTGTTVSSESLAGRRYLLWFYPRAMTPGCTAEGKALRDRAKEFSAENVEIVGVSFDDPATNAEFVRQEGFPFRLLSDTERRLAAAVGAADSIDQPVARRISYLVGPEGKVERAYGTVEPAAHASTVLEDVRAARSGD